MLSFAIAAALGAQAVQMPTPTPPPAPTSAPTRQQAFDAAAAAAEREDWAEALRLFDLLEARLLRGKTQASLALVRLRRGEALVKLGRTSEAEASVRAGFAALPQDASLREDRIFAQLLLGEIAERRFDFAAASRGFAGAYADGPVSPFAERALLGKLRAHAFVDAQAAATEADAAIAGVTANDKAAKEKRARLRTLKGRALLNTGDFAGGLAELERAVKELGGLTLRVSYTDLVARSDLALAALLAGKPEKAREYLAYTGAGRFDEAFLPTPTDGKLPACGGEAGLRPEDVAVVELALRDNGSVAFVVPIYASRAGVAAAFAANASRWRWNAKAVAKLPELIRSVTRLELRCRQAPDDLSVMEYLEREHDRWAAAPAFATGQATDTLPLGALRARLAEASAASPAVRLGLLKALVDHPSSDRDGVVRSAAMALDAVRAGGAPAIVRAYWHLRKARLDADGPDTEADDVTERMMASAELIARDPVLAGDPRARAAVALMLAGSLPNDEAGAQGEALLRGVADDPSLAADDDLKIGAKLRLASLMSATGEPQEARRIYEAIGLAPDRCPVLDVSRAVARLNADSGDFPQEAARWGFEGWTETEVMIGADGRATGARTVVAYPPFVFGKAGETIGRTSRYQPSFRGENEARCGGQSQRVRFVLPR